MNAKDLLAAIEAHAADYGETPIYLAEGVWHAAKQTFMLAFGEGTMFPALGYPESFLWRGTPVVYDREGKAGDTAASKAIADLAVVAGPAINPLAMHPDAPQAEVRVGQPRPELEAQTDEHAEPQQAFSTAVSGDARVVDPVLGDGGSSLVPDTPGERTEGITGPVVNDPSGDAPAPRTSDEAPEPTGFKAMSQHADEEHSA